MFKDLQYLRFSVDVIFFIDNFLLDFFLFDIVLLLVLLLFLFLLIALVLTHLKSLFLINPGLHSNTHLLVLGFKTGLFGGHSFISSFLISSFSNFSTIFSTNGEGSGVLFK